ncbi:MAG: hypothetical protein EOP36_17315 [Rubrivivax sp.]|nr:MAG: hypothetical protein EOP36_17315 [Rubrivivax sp.]
MAIAAPQAQAQAAKRAAPPVVQPVETKGLRIEAVHWGRDRGLGQNGGYIEALDKRTGQSVWLLQVYKVKQDPRLEQDAQDRFIRRLALTLGGTHLFVVDKRGQCFKVDLATHQVAKAAPDCVPPITRP